MTISPTQMQKPFIIPVGGGKGGVGKSFFTANLAMALAEVGKSTIVIDLDLGGSNLYSWLGVRNTYPGIGDFLFSKKLDLNEFLVKDIRDNLSYIPGDGQSAGLANIMHLHKLKIIRSIGALEADFILLDLSAGSTFNTLDFFNMSCHGIIVTVPEMISIMNALGFLKNFCLRMLSRKFSKNIEIMEILNSFRKRPVGKEAINFSEIIKKIEELDPGEEDKVRNTLKRYVPRIVFNMGRSREDLLFGDRLREILNDYLMMNVEFIGFIFWDINVIQAMNKGEPFWNRFPDCATITSIKKIANRLVKYRSNMIENSFERLYASLDQ